MYWAGGGVDVCREVPRSVGGLEPKRSVGKPYGKALLAAGDGDGVAGNSERRHGGRWKGRRARENEKQC